MSVICVPGAELTDALAREWRLIQHADVDLVSPFFSHEFTREVAGVRDDVEVAVIEGDSGIVGFLPFHRDASDIARPIGFRLSDLHGVVARKDAAWDPTELLHGAGLRAWLFNNVPASQAGLRPYHFAVEEAPFIDLSGGFDGYVAGRRASSSKLIEQIHRKQRKIGREVGDLRFEFRTEAPQVFESLLRWKSERRVQTRTLDVLKLDWVRRLLARLPSISATDFSGVLSALWAGDTLVAAHLGIRSNTVFHFWFSAFNGDYGRYSPGAILLMELARGAAATGCDRLDLGKGDEPFKGRFASGAITLAEGSVDRRPMHQTLRRGFSHMRRWVRNSPLRGPLKAARRWGRTIQAPT